MRITVRALRRDGAAANAAAGQEKLHCFVNSWPRSCTKKPSAAQETIGWIARIANDLEHPCSVRINTNAGDVNDARLHSITKRTTCLTVPKYQGLQR